MARKQLEIPGTERVRIEEIESAADNYVKVRDKRMRLTEQEVAAKVNLLQILLQNEEKLSPNAEGDKTYAYDDEIVILRSGKRNVKVKAVKDSEGEDEDE